MREGVLMNEQLLKMNGLSVKILDMLSFESHLGMRYEFTTENIQTYLNDVAGV
jgi:putative GTP pyrophosphokinase